VRALYDEDRAGDGYISNLSELMSRAFMPSSLTFRQRGILVTAAASALGDSYLLPGVGGKLGKTSDAALAAAVLNGSDTGLTVRSGMCGSAPDTQAATARRS